MYLTIDLASPVQGEYLMNTRAKNRILRYWDRTTQNELDVFDRFYYYHKGRGGVQDDDSHLQVYSLLGMDIDELRGEDYDGIEKAWLYFSYENFANYVSYTNQDLLDYANEVCKPNKKHMTLLNYRSIYYTRGAAIQVVILSMADEQANAQALLNAGYNKHDFDMIQKKNNNPADFIALQDTDEVLFTRTTTIGYMTIKDKFEPMDKYASVMGDEIHQIACRVEFTIKEGVTVEDCADLFAKVRASNYININFLGYVDSEDGTAMFTSVQNYYNYEEAYKWNGTGFEQDPVNPLDNPTGFDWYLSVDAVKDMKSKDFVKVISSAIQSDYEEESASGWGIVLNILIAVVAVILFPVTVGASVGLLAFATSAMITLSVIMVAQMVLAYVFQSMGQYGNAILTGKAMILVQSVSKIVGFLALFASVMHFAQQGFTKAILDNTGKEIGRRVLESGEISMKILNWLGQGMSAYTDYEQAQMEEDEAALQAKVDEQKEAEMLSRTPQAMMLMQQNFESYSFLDTNEKMENIPYDLTQGKIDNATTKYFS